MLLIILFTLLIGAYAWASENELVDWPKELVYAAKIVLGLVCSIGNNIVFLLGLFLWGTGIDRQIRAWINRTTAIDKESWWGKIIFTKYGKVWAERLVWAELIIFTIIALL